ncbi:MAG TPA: ABC transporter permease [Thermoanaerobaculia bacterium]|nr:ABC transporter permease [Thermoanaerobaculia bacterium]
MTAPVRQLRQTLRSLGRTPLFTVVATLTLAIGIGAATAVWSVVYGVLLKPLPFPEPERLVGVWHKAPGLGFDRLNQNPALYFTYREGSRAFSESGMWDNTTVSVTGLAQPEQLRAIQVTDGVFPLLRETPLHGRLFSKEDDSPGTAETVILSHAYWQQRFAADPAVIGRSLVVDGRPREVIGVMRPELDFLDYEASVFLPFRLDRSKLYFGNFSYQGIARLAPGATLDDANAEITRLLPVAMDSYPMPEGFSRAMVDNAGLGPNVRPLKQDVVGDVAQVLWVILATVGLVLLVACANVANLFLVRAEHRQHELAVRSALGATRGQVSRELLTESLLLGLSGGVLGLGLAWLGLGLLRALEPRGLPRLGEIGLDGTVLAFTLGLSLLTAVIFGGVVALRIGGSGMAGTLKEEGRGSSAGRGRQRARNALVVSQIAVALVLLVGSGLLIRTFQALVRVNPGFERPEEVLTCRLSVPRAEVEEPIQVARVFESLQARLAAIPGVSSVGLTSSITLDGWDSNDPIFVEDKPVANDTIPPLRRMKWIAPGYFETMQNPVLVGRAITWDDIHQKTEVAVVTQALAREYWSRPEEALGKRIRSSPRGPWREIVGVTADVRDDGLDQKETTLVYWPMVMENWWDNDLFVYRDLAVVLRSERVGTPGLLDDVRKAVWSVNSNLPLANVRTLQEILERSMARTSFTVAMLGIAALTALLLGAVGTYGVTSYAAAQRTREIGVRMALGARREDVRTLVLRHGLTLAGIGVVVGLAAAAGLTRVLATLLYGVTPLDPLTFTVVTGAVVLVALVASWAPARRAAGIDPMVTLRRG